MASGLKIAMEKKEKAFKKFVVELDSGELVEFKNGSSWLGICKGLHEPRIFDDMGKGV